MICISCNREIEKYRGRVLPAYDGKCVSCRAGIVPTGDDKRKDVCVKCGQVLSAVYDHFSAATPTHPILNVCLKCTPRDCTPRVTSENNSENAKGTGATIIIHPPGTVIQKTGKLRAG
jgi:hypothetical protein